MSNVYWPKNYEEIWPDLYWSKDAVASTVTPTAQVLENGFWPTHFNANTIPQNYWIQAGTGSTGTFVEAQDCFWPLNYNTQIWVDDYWPKAGNASGKRDYRVYLKGILVKIWRGQGRVR